MTMKRQILLIQGLELDPYLKMHDLNWLQCYYLALLCISKVRTCGSLKTTFIRVPLQHILCAYNKTFIVCFSFLPMMLPAGSEDSINLNTLRTFRVLRPLKLVSGVPSKYQLLRPQHYCLSHPQWCHVVCNYVLAIYLRPNSLTFSSLMHNFFLFLSTTNTDTITLVIQLFIF